MSINTKGCILFSLTLLCIQQLFSQNFKPNLDTAILGKWSKIDLTQLSNDGNYFMYSIKNPVDGTRRIILKATNNQWEYSWTENLVGFSGFFSGNNKEFVFKRNDTLHLLTLGKNQIRTLTGINSYKTPQVKLKKWLAYHRKNETRELVLLNLFSGGQYKFSNVLDYSFDDSANNLMIKTFHNGVTEFKRIDVAGDIQPNTFWSSDSMDIDNYMFDRQGKQLVFTVVNRNKPDLDKSIWYYNLETGTVKERIGSNLQSFAPGCTPSGTPEFSRNGRWIFFNLQESVAVQNPISQNLSASVDIWHYKDAFLQSEQIREKETEKKHHFTAVISATGGKVIRLDYPDELILTGASEVTGDFVLIADQQAIRNESYWWIHSARPSCYILSLKDGSRRVIKSQSNNFASFTFSPSGKWLVFWDGEQAAYYSYNTENGNLRSLTGDLPVKFEKEYITEITHNPVVELSGTGFWHPDDAYILLYDNYDIWKLDPASVVPPENITNGYGKKNNVKFRLIDRPGSVLTTKNLLLTAFNSLSKHNGFYRCDLSRKGDPDSLFMGPYTFFKTESQLPVINFFSLGATPDKAINSSTWVVQKQSATEAPNWFITSDFKKFRQLTFLQPQQVYNWLTAELIKYKQLDGTQCQAIVYKPENFNPLAKYPVLFNFYESLSQRLYEFPYPDYSFGNINIPWFVSNGYIVVTPDFHYSPASSSDKVVGEHVYNSIAAAVEYLGRLPYINKKRMGIQGHSFGGLETSYLATHTDLFVAAAEAAGSTDPLSAYLTLVGPGGIDNISKQEGIEKGHEFYGATPWERPDLYQKNSSILSADKCTVPLLIMHNKKDASVQWRQGIELYMALRRLSKPCWLMQYDNGTHTVKGNDAKDYTIRMQQFFDHYLKNAPAPAWMTRGIPARLKGIETGYAYDPSGNCGKDCKVCKSWNEMYRKDSVATLQEIDRRKKEDHWQ